MKIWLDDIRQSPENWIHIKTVEELIPFFNSHIDEIQEISLDHDLGLDFKTGYDFIVWLEGRVIVDGLKKIPVIKIHSVNPVGRKKMKQAINRIHKWIKEGK